ncbi:MAG: type III pantothenate kinase [Bacteroidota bacterium]
MQNLSIDIGNTRVKVGIFQKGDLIVQKTVEQLSVTDLNALLTNHSIQNIIYSSVAEIGKPLLDYLKSLDAVELSHQTPLPFENQYDTPQTLGKDRMAAVAGAMQYFPNENSLVIDAGTCITYDWLKAGKQYLGGNISPGWKMRLQAMHQLTDALPLAEAVWQEEWIGKSTLHALQNGATQGILFEMRGIIDQSKSDWEQINVILTGGDSIFFANRLKRKIFARSDLVLTGLNKILEGLF